MTEITNISVTVTLFGKKKLMTDAVMQHESDLTNRSLISMFKRSLSTRVFEY